VDAVRTILASPRSVSDPLEKESQAVHPSGDRPATNLAAALIAVAAIGALAGCGGSDAASTSPSASPSASPSVSANSASSAPAASSEAAEPAAGQYIDYATYQQDSAKYADGKVVLFFHAPWCPDCQRTQKNLDADPASIPAGVTIVKVDFDSETDLRQKYGVTRQHTFVSVGADGAQQKVWSGTDTGASIAARA
jgi:thioredoxin 1